MGLVLNKRSLSDLLSAIFILPDGDGHYPPELADYLKKISQVRPLILFSFPPKCGGTFLRAAAVRAVSGQLSRVCYGLGGGETQFYLPNFLLYYNSDENTKIMVMHGHTLARKGIRRFLQALDLRPVTMIRSIPDMLVSQRDDILNNEMLDECVSCMVPGDFLTMSEADQAEFLINIAAPWYASYYASWFDYAKEEPDRVLVLHFDDFREHPADVLSEVLAHSRISCTKERCAVVIQDIWDNRSTVRYNKGVPGRGRKFFSAEQIKKLTYMLSQYPVLHDHMDELLK